MTTYKLKVVYRDGTGHAYANLSRSKLAKLVSRQFDMQFDRPETVTVTTQRDGWAES